MHWSDCRQKLSADIEGSMTKSILECHKILGCKCCGQSSVLDDLQKKIPEEVKKDKLD